MTLFEMSVRTLRDAVVSRRVSAREVLEAHRHQNDKVGAKLGATIPLDVSPAIEAASLVDERLARSQPEAVGPLAGVPVGIKDIFDVRGWPTRAGAGTYADQAPAEADSTLVRQIRGAGGVIAAKLACHELACGVFTPGVANPWDLSRSAGGSSGGSAAAVAAGLLPLATGSDTGGSIRIPAALCGLVGFKPSFGLLSTTGVRPLSWSLDHVGPIGRTVDCVRLFMEATAEGWPTPAGTPDRRGDTHMSPPRLGYLREGAFGPVRGDVERRFEETLDDLGSAIAVEEVSVPGLERSLQLEFSIILPEFAAEYGELLKREHPGLSRDIRETLLGGLLLPGYVYLRAQAERRRLTASVGRLMDERGLDAIVCPTVPSTAQEHNQTMFDLDGVEEGVQQAFVRTTGPWNLTGQPSAAVPMGLVDDGLPASLQVVGRSGADAEVLDIAELFEKARGTRIVPGLPPRFENVT